MYGIDTGYGNTKVKTDTSVFMFPSVYAPYIGDDFVRESEREMAVTLDGQLYLVGEAAMIYEGDSVFNREDLFRHKICVLTGIAKDLYDSGKDSYKGKVAMGLPVQDMKAMSSKLEELKGKYTVGFNGKEFSIQITKAKVFPQAAAVISNLSSHNKDIQAENVAIIDIGQKTVDYAVYRDGLQDRKRSGSIEFGMYNAYSVIRTSIIENMGFSDFDPYLARRRLLQVERKPDSEARTRVLENAKDAYKNLAMQIQNRLTSTAKWSFNDFDEIFLIGGGAHILKEYFSNIDITEVEQPEYANAIAFYEEGE